LSTPQITNGQTTGPAVCAHCGETLLDGGRFCAGCGHPIDTPPIDAITAATIDPAALGAEDAGPEETTVVIPPTAAPPTAGPPLGTPAGPSRSRGPLLAVIAGALVLAAAAAAAFLLLGSSDKPRASTVYKAKVAAAFGPVLGANRQVSDTLARLRGTKVKSSARADARVAVRRAQQSVTLATGAVGALDAPAASEQLARDARNALDRESAYYAEVARVLNKPASTSTGNVSELASNLTSALSVAGKTVAGTAPTVQGSDRLVAWAQTIRKHSGGHSTTSHPPHAPTDPPANRQPSPPAGGTACGGSLFAGPNTSCAFAANVRAAWLDAPGATNTVRVYSPVTSQTYTMSCSPSGGGITCSGGNNASVTFDA